MSRTSRNLAIFIALVAALLFWFRSREHDSGPHVEAPAAASRRDATDERAAATTGRSHRDDAETRRASREQPAASSLRGTDVAGGLLVDADGNFVATREAVAFFEYFLSTRGERPDEAILATIRAEIAKRLEPPAEAQALAFFGRYLLYRERGVALGLTDPGDDADLRARFDKLRSLRREIFGEEVATRLFGEEEQESEVAIRQREVADDPKLSDEEKAAQIEKLYDDLPEEAREARKTALSIVQLQQDEARIRANGGTDADIRKLRVDRFGEEAADRLEAVDRENAEWERRYGDYRSQRARILEDRSLSDSDRAVALERLLEESFSDNERIRARALDTVE